MEKIVITGGTSLSGTIRISGAKNAALPLLTAAILTDEPIHFQNVPNLSDIEQLIILLEQHGAIVNREQNKCSIHVKDIISDTAPYEIVRKMRASILVLGPLLARNKKAVVSLPGGCAIGTRPVNIHIEGLEAFGAKISIENGYIYAKAPNGLIGSEFTMPVVSVTGTENLLMAATLAKGRSILKNAAKEPEVCDLANCLISMGAKIEGIGADTLIIEGVDKLHGTTHSVIPDRIEAATYAIAAAITNGNVTLENVSYDDLSCFFNSLEKSGANIEKLTDSSINIKMSGDIIGTDIMTAPFPGFPTDAQAQFMSLMTICNGASMITETIFENRFMHVPELCRMGADITVHNSSALVRGVKRLTGANVMATDLRASVALVLAGLIADGKTEVHRIYHLDRGYERIEEKLQKCGAIVERLKDD